MHAVIIGLLVGLHVCITYVKQTNVFTAMSQRTASNSRWGSIFSDGSAVTGEFTSYSTPQTLPALTVLVTRIPKISYPSRMDTCHLH